MSGAAPLGRLVGLAMICAGLGTATLATAQPAGAATADSPTAIGVSSGGTSYVGFASGGKLLRFSSSGKAKPAVRLDSDEAVDGIFVTANDDIWVDYETGFSLLTPRGRVVTHVDHDPLRECDASAPAHRYGGITANGNRIYLANRCHDSVSVYARNGDLVATVDLPGNDFPRGITYGGPQAGRPATLYVAIPDRGQILAYNAARLHGSSRPIRTFTVPRPNGGSRPEPGGLAVDKWGQLTATDMANNALYLLDTNNGFSLYRTLGHPPRASRAAGRLNGPGALAQHAQDGGSLSGNLFIAETGNHRVQRWDTGGYTYWTKAVRGPAGGGGGNDDGNGDVPANLAPPEVGGDAVVGGQLTCYPGAWDGDPETYQRGWLRDGAVISGATGTTYTVAAADDGSRLACRVRAGNDAGYSAWVASDPVTIGGGGTGDGPTNVSPPTISGTPAVGQVLTCNPGSWSSTGGGFISYGYTWKRAGTAIAGATTATYTVVAADAGTALSCTVRAADQKGSTVATSAGVPIGAGSGAAPANTGAPVISGSPSAGELLTCLSGTWTGTGITYGYAWKRNGVAIPAATWSTYTVLSEDVSDALTCTVTATNAQGSAQATSAVLVVPGPSGHAPSNSVAPSVSGTAAVGQTLTCDPGTWAGVPELVYSYKWQRNGADVSGATAATYAVTAADGGTSLRCLVVVANGYGRGAVPSPAVAVTGGGPGGACSGPVGVSINAGATLTASRHVTLLIRPPAGTTSVTISNDGGFADAATLPLSASCTYAWTMESIPGSPLTWPVYVRFGSDPTTYWDTIVVSEPAPRGTVGGR